MSKTINVLWTGGLDSSYLIFRLAQHPGQIQPYYVIDPTRYSTNKELEAIEAITSKLRQRSDIKASILPIKTVSSNDVKTYQDIAEAWKTLHDKCALGSQYNFLACFARQYDLKLAVGALFGERSKVEMSMRGTTELVASAEYPDLFLEVASSHRGTAAHTVFERLYFPTFMRNLEKTAEWEYFKQSDALDIARLTWFCHHPVMGLTCGHCAPCKDALNEGMSFRVSRVGYVLADVRRVGNKLLSLFR